MLNMTNFNMSESDILHNQSVWIKFGDNEKLFLAEKLS